MTPTPRDAAALIAACGTGDVRTSVLSMSSRHPDGLDAAYLEWHVLDHLPEQHRLDGLRHGKRFVSSPACRSTRAASRPPFDAVDHLVHYLFADPVAPSLEQFFALGGALGRAGRMPIALPRVEVGGWDLARTTAAARVLVGGAVLPWRHCTGVYVLVEDATTRPADEALDALIDVPGVAGVWEWIGVDGRHDRLEPTAGRQLTLCYLDASPPAVASALTAVVRAREVEGVRVPLLAAPFEAVVPGEWGRALP